MTAAKNSRRAAKRGSGRPFRPGTSGNPGGRKPGTLNKTTLEARAIATAIVTDARYLRRLMQRARAGELGAMEPLLWYFSYGRPIDRVALNVTQDRPYKDWPIERLEEAVASQTRRMLANDPVMAAKILPGSNGAPAAIAAVADDDEVDL